MTTQDLMEIEMDRLIEKADKLGVDLLICCRISGEQDMFQALFKDRKDGKGGLPQMAAMLHRILESAFKNVPLPIFAGLMLEIIKEVKKDLWGDKE